MKGAVRLWLILSKGYFIGSLVAFTATALFGCIFLPMIVQNDVGAGFFQAGGIVLIYAMILVSAVLPTESIGKEFEKTLKTRFADYIRSCAETPRAFVLSQLVKNLIATALAAAYSLALSGIFIAFGNGFIEAEIIKITLFFCLLFGVTTWVTDLLIVKFKSEEKASLAFGLLIFAIVFPVSAIAGYLNYGTDGYMMQFITDILASDLFLPCAFGAVAVIYAVVYLLFVHRVRKGDVC